MLLFFPSLHWGWAVVAGLLVAVVGYYEMVGTIIDRNPD